MSAMRRARSAPAARADARLDQRGELRQLAFGHLREEIEHGVERRRSRAGRRQ